MDYFKTGWLLTETFEYFNHSVPLVQTDVKLKGRDRGMWKRRSLWSLYHVIRQKEPKRCDKRWYRGSITTQLLRRGTRGKCVLSFMKARLLFSVICVVLCGVTNIKRDCFFMPRTFRMMLTGEFNNAYSTD